MNPYSGYFGYTPLLLIRGKRTPTRVQTPPKNNRTLGYLDCGRGLVRVTIIYLEYTQPRGQARVYRFVIHWKSLRPEEYIWKL